MTVRTGASAGDQMTVTGYTSGGAYTYGTCENATGGSIGCPTLVAGTAVAEVLTSVAIQGNINTNVIGGWASNDSNCLLSTADKFEGLGSLACNVADGSTHEVHFGWDTYANTTGGVCSGDNNTPCTSANQSADCASAGGTCLEAPQAGPWHPFVGSFEASFWAKGVNTSTGTPKVQIELIRENNSPITMLNHTFTLTNDGAWHQYTATFTGTDIAGGAPSADAFFD